MELKDFVAETLRQIIDGVSVAQAHGTAKGRRVNPQGLTFRTDQGMQMFDGKTGQPAQLIEFDVAVSTAEGTQTKGGVGILVGPVGLGSQGRSDAGRSSSSRIKFSVPVLLPCTE